VAWTPTVTIGLFEVGLPMGDVAHSIVQNRFKDVVTVSLIKLDYHLIDNGWEVGCFRKFQPANGTVIIQKQKYAMVVDPFGRPLTGVDRSRVCRIEVHQLVQYCPALLAFICHGGLSRSPGSLDQCHTALALPAWRRVIWP
jgi:hypothetical protein